MEYTDLTSRFNDHLATSVFVFCNEATWGGDKSKEGILKAMITDDSLSCEKKYMPKFRVRNCTHLMIATNSDWFAPIGMDDRRFVVLDVSEHKTGDTEYFNQVRHERENGGKEAFIYYLLNEVDLTGFNHRELPANQGESKLDNKLRSAGNVENWWYQCLMDDEILVADECEKTKFYDRITGATWMDSQVYVKTKDLHESYLQWCTKHNEKFIEPNYTMIKTLNKYMPSRMTTYKPKGSERQKIIPSLKDCRNKFESVIKQEVDWDD